MRDFLGFHTESIALPNLSCMGILPNPTVLVNPPLPPSDCLGVVQSDVLLRQAILAALADLRAKSWLLDYCFAWLRADPLSQGVNSDRDIREAKAWFFANNIRVVPRVRVEAAHVPCISIEVDSSTERDNTTGDDHYVAREPVNQPWNPMTVPFTPLQWNPMTGVMVLPAAVAETLQLDSTLLVVTAKGNAYQIQDVLNPQTLALLPDINDNFDSCTINPPQPSLLRHVQSAVFEEGYTLGCHVAGEPVYCQYLHSILVFCLLRYRKQLLEARGLECTKISSGSITKDDTFGTENVYTREVSVDGLIRQVWPVTVEPAIATVESQVKIIGVPHIPFDPTAAPLQTVQVDSLIGEDDSAVVPPVNPLQTVGWQQPPDFSDATQEDDPEGPQNNGED